MEDKKSYSVKELATILGCSVTAVQKKITTDENNPEIKRYKKRFNVVSKDGKTVILLSDEELEQEKRLSKGFNNVNTTNNGTFETIIDVEPEVETQATKDNTIDKILKFTNDQIESYKTLHETYMKELLERDKKILYLTVFENESTEKTAQVKQLEEKEKQLEKRNRLLTFYLTFVTTLLLTLIGLFITFYITVDNLHNPDTEKPSIEQVSTVEM